MNQLPPFRTRHARRAPLDAMIDRLQPALQGYPVKELVELWIEVESVEGAAPCKLIELCITSWIARLDDTAASASGEVPDEFSTRQRCARHALELVKARFTRSAVVHAAQRADRARVGRHAQRTS